MKRLTSLVAVLLASALAGCGGNLCSKAAGLNLQKKVAACNVTGVTVYDEAKCNEAIKTCTDADKKALQAGVDCLGNVPDCTAATQDQWVNQVNACIAQGQTSQACPANL